MKAYKGFNKDMTCRGFQYEEGKEYECDEAKICEKGFHACEDPLDCFLYYSPSSSVYHEVEIEDNGQKDSEDSRVVGKKIKIGAKLSVADICKLHFEFAKEHTINNQNSGQYSAIEGGNGSAIRSGYCSAVESGDCSTVESGRYSAIESGDGSAVKSGSCSAIKSGDFSAIESECCSAVKSGKCSAVESGEYSVIYVNGGSKAKGGFGSVLAFQYWKGGELADIVIAKINNKRYKADTWYALDENGKVVKVD